MDSIVPGK